MVMLLHSRLHYKTKPLSQAAVIFSGNLLGLCSDFGIDAKVDSGVERLFSKRRSSCHSNLQVDVRKCITSIDKSNSVIHNTRIVKEKIMRVRKWTEESVRNEAANYSTRREFKLGNKSAYHAGLSFGLMEELFGEKRKAQARIWTDENVRREAKKYSSRSAFYYGNCSAYESARKLGILLELFPVSYQASGGSRIWHRSDVLREAAKYKTRKEFFDNNSSAYAAAKKLGVFEEACAHMEFVRTYWTNEMLELEARKYQHRSDMESQSNVAYNTIIKRGLSKQYLSHMTRKTNPQSSNVIYLWEAVGCRFNGNKVFKIGITSTSSRKMRIAKVSKDGGLKSRLMCYCKTTCDVIALEKELLTIGDNPQYVGFDGCTEFRAMSEDQLAMALNLIEKNTVEELEAA